MVTGVMISLIWSISDQRRLRGSKVSMKARATVAPAWRYRELMTTWHGGFAICWLTEGYGDLHMFSYVQFGGIELLDTFGYYWCYWLVGVVKLINTLLWLGTFCKTVVGNRLRGRAELKENSVRSTMACIREACAMPVTYPDCPGYFLFQP